MPNGEPAQSRSQPRRTRSAPATRAAILAAARTRFSGDGYERTTLRAIAADVGVDPAMVIRYYGDKKSLFAQAAEFDLQLPDLTDVPHGELGRVLVPHFFRVWEEDGSFLALLRACASNDTAAAAMREVFARQVAPMLGATTIDHPAERAALVGAFVLGLAVSRTILATPALADLSRTELSAWLEPTMTWLLTGVQPSR